MIFNVHIKIFTTWINGILNFCIFQREVPIFVPVSHGCSTGQKAGNRQSSLLW